MVTVTICVSLDSSDSIVLKGTLYSSEAILNMITARKSAFRAAPARMMCFQKEIPGFL